MPAFMPTSPVTLQHSDSALKSIVHHCKFKILGHLLALLRRMHGLHCLGRLGKHSLMHVTPADWCAQAMSQILDARPPLRFDADSIVYTDGSKQGPSITAAWVQPSTMATQSLILGGSASPQRTPVRAELVALHAALHSPSFPLDQPLTMMTDSLTSQQLLATHLVRPNQHVYHHYRWLVSALPQNLLARDAPVSLMRVKARDPRQ